MKGFLVAVLIVISINSNAQGLGGLLKKVSGDSSLNKVIGSAAKGKLSTDDIAAGLKEALNVGVRNGTAQLSAADGFFKNAAVKILMPPEALKAEKTLRDMGLSKQVDDAILSMNRAAEDAAKSASPIFVSAIKQMTIQDAAGILKGGDSAATMYLKQKTALPLTNAFSPIIKESLS